MALAETAKLAVELNLTGNYQTALPAAQRAFGSIGTAAGKLGGALSHAGGQIKNLITSPLGLLGLAGGLYGVERAIQGTITSAMDFQSSMELLRTQTGATQGEVDSMSESVLALSKSLPQGPNELAAGLYHIESAGFRGAKALDILKIAAEGAATGNADLESVTNALVGAQQSGIKGAEDLGIAMGSLNAIVGAGNMRMQDLVDSFGSGILATARTFGVSIQAVGAALATMTDEGIPAVDAATRLRMSLSLLGAPTAKAIDLLKGIGIGQYDLADALRSPNGFVAALGLLRDHMVKAGLIGPDGNPNPQGAALLSRAFGGGRSSAAIMTLLSNFSLLEQKQAAVTKGAGSFTTQWEAAAQTAKVKFGQFVSTVQELGIRIGNDLLPVVTEALGKLSTWLSTHEGDILRFVHGAVGAIKDFAGVVGGIVGKIGDFWGAIPSDVRDLLLKGFAADRTIKWLFGFDPAGAAIGALKNALTTGLATGFGKSLATAGLGKLFVQPVFVTNPGFGAGGLANAAGAGLGGLGADVGIGAGVIGLGPLLAVAAPLIAVAVIAALNAKPTTFNDKGQQTSPGPAGGSYSAFYNPSGPKGGYTTPATTDAATTIQHAGDDWAQAAHELATTQRAGDHWERDNTAALLTNTHALHDPAWLKKWEQAAFHSGLQKAIVSAEASLVAGVNVRRSALLLGAEVGAHGVGAGGAPFARRIIAELNTALGHTSDPATRKAIVSAIEKLTARLPRLEQNSRNLHLAEQIATSSETQKQKLADLDKIMADVKAHGDRTTQRRLQDLINQVKHQKPPQVNVNIPIRITNSMTTTRITATTMVSGGTSSYNAQGGIRL